MGVGGADGDLALGSVAHRHRGQLNGLADVLASLLWRAPEAGPVVQVEHRVATAVAALQNFHHGGAGRLLGEAGSCRPQHGHGGGDVGDVGGYQVHLRAPGLAVEQQRRVGRRVEGAEGQSGAQVGVGGHIAVLHAEHLGQFVADVLPEAVIPHPGHHRGPPAQPGTGHGHVGGGAADRFGKRLHPAQRHAALLGIQIDADPPDGQHFEVG